MVFEMNVSDAAAVPQLLYTRNEAWAADIVNHPYTADFFPRHAEGQSPKILWIGCSDSRVPETVLTKLAPGDIFVHRNIANQFHASELDLSAHAALDYAVKHLHVQHVAIVGHTHCGGIQAAYNRATEGLPDHVTIDSVKQKAKKDFKFQHDHRHLLPAEFVEDDPIITWLTPLTNLARDLDYGVDPNHHEEHPLPSVTLLTDENVKLQVKNLVSTFPKGEAVGGVEQVVWVHGWVYEVETGRLRDLEVTEKCVAYVKPKGDGK